MNNIALLIIILTLIIVLLIINALFSLDECPDSIDSSFRECNQSSDCYFNLKYGCINNKPLECIITGDLSARESASKLISCSCVNNLCVEVMD